MAIIQCIPTSCKAELLNGIHDFGGDEFRIALYGPDADIGPNTTAYTTDGEVVGTGYISGGQELMNQAVQNSNGSAWVYWDNPSWPGASFSACGAMIYNYTKDNRAVMILNFGLERQFDAASNAVTFPPATASTALMRLT